MDSIYEKVEHESADLVADYFEAGHSVEKLSAQLGFEPDTVQHMLSCIYFDGGRIDEAERLARQAMVKYPGPEMHSLLLRCLLASPRDTKQGFFDESVRWAELYEGQAGAMPDRAFELNADP